MYIDYRYVEGYDNKYIVSNYGDVISCKGKKPRVLKPISSKRGYYLLTLRNNGIQKTIKIHVLVGNAFIGKRENGLTYDHIDRDSLNNRADNIRLATKSQQSINRGEFKNNKTGEKNISIQIQGNCKSYYCIKITRQKRSVSKYMNMNKYNMSDAIKYRDEQLRIISAT